MPLTVIAGQFRIVGTQPDGDSVRFTPTDAQAWTKARIPARVNASGGAQLRLDAIDALETHYVPPHGRGRLHQPLGLAEAATGALLTRLGFSGVTTDSATTVNGATPPAVDGFVLTRFADTYGRPVALVFAGMPSDHGIHDVNDLGSVYVDEALLAMSANYGLLADGLAYPTFYTRLYASLRAELAAVSVAAREAALGVWAQDATLPGFSLTSRDQLSDELVILPKLFRRLAEYLALSAEPDQVSLARFGEFLAAHGDLLFTVPEGDYTTLDSLVEVDGRRVRLTVPPERIVFAEK